MFLVSSCNCLYPIQWSQVLSREWWCSWNSADRRCSNYIWVINNFIAYLGAPYIRDFTVTRTTRTPAFWDTLAASWLPILVIHIRSQVKTWQSQSYKFKKIAKNSNFEILLETFHTTHLLKLLDKMYKYEMDPTRTVGATQRTRDAGWTDRWTEWNQYTPQQLRCARGIIILLSIPHQKGILLHFIIYIKFNKLSNKTDPHLQIVCSHCIKQVTTQELKSLQ